jgi:hypothetical protein
VIIFEPEIESELIPSESPMKEDFPNLWQIIYTGIPLADVVLCMQHKYIKKQSLQTVCSHQEKPPLFVIRHYMILYQGRLKPLGTDTAYSTALWNINHEPK